VFIVFLFYVLLVLPTFVVVLCAQICHDAIEHGYLKVTPLLLRSIQVFLQYAVRKWSGHMKKNNSFCALFTLPLLLGISQFIRRNMDYLGQKMSNLSKHDKPNFFKNGCVCACHRLYNLSSLYKWTR